MVYQFSLWIFPCFHRIRIEFEFNQFLNDECLLLVFNDNCTFDRRSIVPITLISVMRIKCINNCAKSVRTHRAPPWSLSSDTSSAFAIGEVEAAVCSWGRVSIKIYSVQNGPARSYDRWTRQNWWRLIRKKLNEALMKPFQTPHQSPEPWGWRYRPSFGSDAPVPIHGYGFGVGNRLWPVPLKVPGTMFCGVFPTIIRS